MRRSIAFALTVVVALCAALPAVAEMSPTEFAEQLRLAQRYVGRGQLLDAIRIYETLSREVPGDERIAAKLGAALRQVGRFEDALTVYSRADEEQSRPFFLRERLALLRQLDRPADALDLCLASLNAPRSTSRFVEDELLSLAKDPVLWRRAYDQLRLRNAERTTTEPVASALAEICLEGGKYEEAVEVVRGIDRSIGARGTRLLALAKRLDALRQRELALEVMRDVVPMLGDGPHRRDAVLFRAELEVELGRPQEAYEGLTWLTARDPRDPHVYEVHLERADLLAGPLNRPDHAIAIYDTLLADGRLPAIHEQIRLARAETQLSLRRYEGALADCRELAATSRKETVRERAAFMVGEIFFYQGEIDSAAAAYARQVETFPTGLLTNDGLDRIFLFNENYDVDGSALVALGELHELASRGEVEAALTLGDSLATRYALAPIHDDLLYEIASLALSAGQPERALVHLDTISAKYEESRIAPRALELEGEILEEHMGDPGAALVTYEDLLIRYPLSIEASEVRPRVTRLRQEVRS